MDNNDNLNKENNNENNDIDNPINNPIENNELENDDDPINRTVWKMNIQNAILFITKIILILFAIRYLYGFVEALLNIIIEFKSNI